MDNKEKNTQLFMYLVGSFEMSAMMAMGKIKNPMTDKTERDLTQAQFSIDIMDMLKEKTKGQLSEYEAKFLENTLGQLKLNYIDESKKADEPAKVEESAKSEAEPKNTEAEK
ncbi:MAG TPA: DUF1844 domain-containing protein [Ignavibacteria bacterium]|nr:DUF1844 domain-containing protein [Bacteroidota bacterium]HRE11383.1 DUF1844 domain-containing protein [Ignavibacteria bacterium]HRF67476.1 DUF1844 domain-containing protein [Ignavibacteria bacterium]HRJ04736.1 DUF1844 domain-containing protein [Ignavibacteria bacterium]HRJ86732.1 DUF1844 domain-containing protein [Ignavibacteria bacterium]